MSSQLIEMCFAAMDPRRLARFWSVLLGRDAAADGLTVLPGAETEFPLRFVPEQQPKGGPNQIHLHLTSSSPEHQQSTVAHVLALGGTHLDLGQRLEEGHVVLADPEGNELCVIEAGNAYLAGCGFLGELACDGTREVGLFWSETLRWPLVWDQDEETAIQSPLGGPKIAWGGPPVRPRSGPNRMHFHLAPPDSGDARAEVERLVALGAQRIVADHGEAGWMTMADPDGNEFCVREPTG